MGAYGEPQQFGGIMGNIQVDPVDSAREIVAAYARRMGRGALEVPRAVPSDDGLVTAAVMLVVVALAIAAAIGCWLLTA